MKKLLLTAALLGSAFFSQLSNASDFSDKYPNFARMNKLLLTQRIMPIIAGNQGFIQGGTKPLTSGNSELNKGWNDAMGEMTISLKKQNQCLSNIVKSPILSQIETLMVQILSASELTEVDNFYKTPLGQKEIITFEKVNNYMLIGDIKSFENYRNQKEKYISKADENNIKLFEQQHKETMAKLVKVFNDKQITAQIEQYQASCKP